MKPPVTPPIAKIPGERTSRRTPDGPTLRNEKGDSDQYGVGIVNSRRIGDQILIRTKTGEIIVITFCGQYAEGGGKIGIRCDGDVDVVRREIAPLDWIEEAACTGRNPERRKARNGDDA